MPKLFGMTLFISATLLFLVQPMVGRMVLPLLGGTPEVWNTCMVFFQTMLLLGYYYAHKNTSRLPTRKQVAVHAALLLITAGAMAVGAALISDHSPVPIVKSLAPQGSDVPFFGVILLLAAAIGLPFFTISTTAPLLQKWFSETGHPSSKDPYFLYAASNFGSLLALLAYPFVVEPTLKLVSQAWLWAAGFTVLSLLIVACGRVLLSVPVSKLQATVKTAIAAPSPNPHWTTKLRWLLLAAVPSSLMLAVTTDVTTDMVSMPLLWIIPLSLYLLTFIIVFAKSTPSWVHLTATLVTPVLILLVLFTKVVEPYGSINFSRAPMGLQYALHLLPFITFFFVALTCHGELARTRPEAKHLTEFYLIMSFGGVVGGVFNALIAPVVFTFVSEYPITLVAAACLLPKLSKIAYPDPARLDERKPDLFWLIFRDYMIAFVFLAVTLVLALNFLLIVRKCDWLIDQLGMHFSPRVAATILGFGLPILFSYFLVERPVRFGAVIGAIWIGTFLAAFVKEQNRDVEDRAIYARSFFGTIKIESYREENYPTREASPVFNRLVHGTTVHGMQHRYPDEMSTAQVLELFGANTPIDALALASIAEPHLRFPGREPLTYYHRTGPVGVMFDAFWKMNEEDPWRNREVASIGLGTGSVSAYAKPKEKMTIFEIDSTVRRLVVEENHFTFVKSAKKQGCDIDIVMGDARLSMERMDHKWGIMLVDAFSSDSIPAHLLTKQAIKMYFDHLSDDGLLALHISNRYLKLEPVVDNIVKNLKVEMGGLEAIVMHDSTAEYFHPDQTDFSGKLASTWVLVARRKEAFGPLNVDVERWGPLQSDPSVGLWTDDYTPITKAFNSGWMTLLGK